MRLTTLSIAYLISHPKFRYRRQVSIPASESPKPRQLHCYENRPVSSYSKSNPHRHPVKTWGVRTYSVVPGKRHNIRLPSECRVVPCPSLGPTISIWIEMDRNYRHPTGPRRLKTSDRICVSDHCEPLRWRSVRNLKRPNVLL